MFPLQCALEHRNFRWLCRFPKNVPELPHNAAPQHFLIWVHTFEKAILLPRFVVFKVLLLHVIPTQPTFFIHGLPSDFPIVLLKFPSPVLSLTSLTGKVIFPHLLVWILLFLNGSCSSKRVPDDKTQQRANSTNRWTTQKWDSSSNYHASVNNCSIQWTQKLCSLRNA